EEVSDALGRGESLDERTLAEVNRVARSGGALIRDRARGVLGRANEGRRAAGQETFVPEDPGHLIDELGDFWKRAEALERLAERSAEGRLTREHLKKLAQAGLGDARQDDVDRIVRVNGSRRPARQPQPPAPSVESAQAPGQAAAAGQEPAADGPPAA